VRSIAAILTNRGKEEKTRKRGWLADSIRFASLAKSFLMQNPSMGRTVIQI
jgi:hypothetical protein